MLISVNPTEKSVKTSAKILHKAIVVVIAPYSSVHATEQPLRIPSLQQCQTIISQALGFSSHNGLINAFKLGKTPCFDHGCFKQSLKEYLLRCNALDDVVSIMSLADLVTGKELGNLVAKIESMFGLIQSHSLWDELRLPQQFSVHECQWRYTSTSDAYSDQDYIEQGYNWLVSLMIERCKELQVKELPNGKAVIDVPLNFFGKFESITQHEQVESLVSYMNGIFAPLQAAEVSVGELDVNYAPNSIIRWTVPVEHSQAYASIHDLQDYYARADDYLKSLIDIYPDSFINSSNIKKISGASRVWYHLFRSMFYRLIKLRANLAPISVRVCEEGFNEDLGICDLKNYMALLQIPCYSYPQYAVQDLDHQVDELILPLIRKEKQLRDQIIELVQSHVRQNPSSPLLLEDWQACKQLHELRMQFEIELIQTFNNLSIPKY